MGSKSGGGGHKLGMVGKRVGLAGIGEEESKHLHEILEELIKIYTRKQICNA